MSIKNIYGHSEVFLLSVNQEINTFNKLQKKLIHIILILTVTCNFLRFNF